MLLRLLPIPTAEQPAPPTILFTLPLPPQPYTSRSLPLPPNLLMHRTLCVQEGIECSNVLLGDKANWIAGVVDEVTFDMPSANITTHFIDSCSHSIPISAPCSQTLIKVIEQVQMSFSAQAMPAPAVAGPLPPSSQSSAARAAPVVMRRTPSNILYSLLSPLLNNPSNAAHLSPNVASSSSSIVPTVSAAQASRMHRRQARSHLVDAYRRHVLPVLKDILPSTYFSWATMKELSVRGSEWEEMTLQMDCLLEKAGWSSKPPARTATLGRSSRHFDRSTSSVATSSWHNSMEVAGEEDEDEDDGSDSDSATSSIEDDTPPTTPATSIWSGRNAHNEASDSPLSHLAGLPAAAAMPASYRVQYSDLIARMASIASRIAHLEKLKAQIEREEGRKRWLTSLEASRNWEKSTRKAWSNAARTPSALDCRQAFRPLKASPLWRSSTPPPTDVELAQQQTVCHPAMIDIEMDSVSPPDLVLRSTSPDSAISVDDRDAEMVRQPSVDEHDNDLLLQTPPLTTSAAGQLQLQRPSITPSQIIAPVPISIYQTEQIWQITESEVDEDEAAGCLQKVLARRRSSAGDIIDLVTKNVNLPDRAVAVVSDQGGL